MHKKTLTKRHYSFMSQLWAAVMCAVARASALNKSLYCREIMRVALFVGIIPKLSQLFIYSVVSIRQ